MQYNGSNYNDWVNSEYDLWKSELKKFSEDSELFKNFKQNDQVKRMLGSSDLFGPFFEKIKDKDLPWKEIEKIDRIGNPTHVVGVNGYKISGICLRYIYYADKVLNELKEFDSRLDLNMLEIGGGYGGFASVLNCLLKFANKQIDHYGIFDLPEVQDFQSFYLAKTVMHSYGINDFFFPKVLTFIGTDFNYLVSFYALGEFPAELKKHYIENVIAKVPHGFIVWNPHFGPDDEGIELIKRVQPNVQITKEDPLTAEFNLEIKW